MVLWTEISLRLADTYESATPDADFISRIYKFAFWCLAQPPADSADSDLSTAVAVAFIEDIPLHPRVAADLHRWLSTEDFDGFTELFRYHLDENQFSAFRREFLEKKNAAV